MAGSPSWRTDKRKTSERGYGWRWQQERKAFLAQPENVLCVMCKAEGRVTAATVVDHITPHKGDEALMWDQANWQPLCKPHHDGDKQRLENGAAPLPTIGEDGWPTDGVGGGKKVEAEPPPDRPPNFPVLSVKKKDSRH